MTPACYAKLQEMKLICNGGWKFAKDHGNGGAEIWRSTRTGIALAYISAEGSMV